MRYQIRFTLNPHVGELAESVDGAIKEIAEFFALIANYDFVICHSFDYHVDQGTVLSGNIFGMVTRILTTDIDLVARTFMQIFSEHAIAPNEWIVTFYNLRGDYKEYARRYGSRIQFSGE